MTEDTAGLTDCARLRREMDGVDIPPPFALEFVPCSASWSGWSGTVIEVSFHLQRYGARTRPLLFIAIGPAQFQLGWRWFDPTGEVSE
jgi:hypothetical protein